MKKFCIPFILIFFLITGCAPRTKTTSTKPEPTTRDNSSAQEVTLSKGDFRVGKDISPGRYVITSNAEGTIEISNLGIKAVSEKFDSTSGIESLTINLIEDMSVALEGDGDFSFVPATTTLLKDTLTTGTWIIGLDLEPGTYVATSEKGTGRLSQFDKKARRKSQTDFTDSTKESEELVLESGDILSIVGLSKIRFEIK